MVIQHVEVEIAKDYYQEGEHPRVERMGEPHISKKFVQNLSELRDSLYNNVFGFSQDLLIEAISSYNYLELIVEDSYRILNYNSGITKEFLSQFEENINCLEGRTLQGTNYSQLLDRAKCYFDLSCELQSKVSLSKIVQAITAERFKQEIERNPNPFYYLKLWIESIGKFL